MKSIFNAFVISVLMLAQVHFAYSQTTSAASLLPNAVQTFLDKNGNPLASGTVTTYIPNTTTKKTTWQDAGKVTPWANPLALNAAGHAPGDVGIYGDGAYRQVVKDRYGNLIWDRLTASTGGSGGGGSATVGDGDAVGTIKPWAGFIAPYGYVFAYGQEIVRASYPEAFAALTNQQNVNCTTGSPTLTGIGATTQLSIGAPIESSCLNAGSTIISKTTSSVTVSSNAIATTTTTAKFFPFGNGDGSLTFNIPDLRGRVIAGNDIMGGIAANRLASVYDSLGGAGGSSTVTIAQSGLPNTSPIFNGISGAVSVTSTSPNIITSSAIIGISASGGTSAYAMNSDAARGGQNSTGSFTPAGTISSINGNVSQTGTSVIQPTQAYNYIIKIIPDSNPNTFFGVASIGGMYGVLECGIGITCVGNTISAVNSTVPTPSAITLGGVFAITCSSSTWINTLSSTGTFGCSQPNFTDLIGIASVTQGGTGQTSFTSNLPLIGNGSGALVQGTVTGTTTKFATSIGTLTSGHCIQVDASGNLVDSGASCGSGGGGTLVIITSAYAVCDGTVDDTTGLIAWMAAINASTATSVTGQVVGNCRLNSASTSGLTISRDNVTITGATNASVTMFGTTVTSYVFGSQNRNFIRYEKLNLIGNSAANAFGNGAAIAYTTSSGNVARSLTVVDNQFQNFGGDYWIYVENNGNSSMDGITVTQNTATSISTSNCRGPSLITISCSFVGVFGSGTNSNYPVSNVRVLNNTVYADYIKSGVVIFNTVQQFWIQDNLIINAGQTGIANDSGAYAIMLYEQSPGITGRGGNVTGNRIYSPRSIGIYIANVWPGTITANNYIVSQGPDTLDATLPKGGIVLNGAYEQNVYGNEIINTTRSAIFVNNSPIANTNVNVFGNIIRGANEGIHYDAATYTGNNISIRNNSIITVTTAGIKVDLYTTGATSNLYIVGNNIETQTAAGIGIILGSPDASYKLTGSRVDDNKIKIDDSSSSVGIRFRSFGTNVSSTVNNNVISGNGAYGISIIGTVGVAVQNNTSIGQGTNGYAFRTADAQGVMSGNNFLSLTSGRAVENSGGNDLGRVKPTWFVGATGQFVQNLQPAEAGAAASKYMVQGWSYDATAAAWLDNRTLTGN